MVTMLFRGICWMVVPDYESKLRLNTIVERMEWQPGLVRVHAGQEWRARRAVITVPLGVLQAGSIEFSPEPVEILHAANQLCFGQVYRVVLAVSQGVFGRVKTN